MGELGLQRVFWGKRDLPFSARHKVLELLDEGVYVRGEREAAGKLIFWLKKAT